MTRRIGHRALEILASKGLLPPRDQCAWRAPGPERTPIPRDNERIFFTSFIERGLSTPTGMFLWQVPSLYMIQLHHLSPSGVMEMACFAAFCEACLGIWHHLGLWCSLFQLVPKRQGRTCYLAPCGAAIVTRRPSNYPDLKLFGSDNSWQCSFFYCPDVMLGNVALA